MAQSIQYNANLALIGPSPSDSDHIGRMNYIRLMQGANISISQPVDDVIGIGAKGSRGRKYLPPKLKGTFNYILSDGVNEKLFGFTVESPLDYQNPERVSFSNGLNSCGGITDEDFRFFNNHNIFILTEKDGNDAVEVENDNLDNFSVFGMGNCYVDSYSLSCGVNEIPNVSLGFSAETFYLADYIPHTTGVSGEFISGMSVPAVSQEDGSASEYMFNIHNEIYRLKDHAGSFDPMVETTGHFVTGITHPSFMEIYVSGSAIGMLSGSNNFNTPFQSLKLNLPIPRREQKSIKSKYNHDKPFVFPLEGSIDFSMIVDEFVEGDARFFGQEDFDIHLKFRGNVGDGSTSYTQEYLNVFIKGAKIQAQSFSQADSRMVWNTSMSFVEGESVNVFDREFHSGEKGIFFSGLSGLPQDDVISLNESNAGAVFSEGAWICDNFASFITLD